MNRTKCTDAGAREAAVSRDQGTRPVVFGLIVIISLSIAGCPSPPPSKPESVWTPQEYADFKARQYEEVAELLKKFTSPDPMEWEVASARLRAIGEDYVSPKTLKLVERLKSASGEEHAAIRKDLAQRGRAIDLLLMFNSPREEDWDAARKEIVGLDDVYVLGAMVFKLVCKFDSDNPRTHDRARRQLVRIGPAAVQPLSAAMQAETSDNIMKHECGRTLAAIAVSGGEPPAFQKVAFDELCALSAHKDDTVRFAATLGLGITKLPDAVPVLGKILNADKNENIRAEAVSALGEMGAEAVSHLASAVERYFVVARRNRSDESFMEELDSERYIAIESITALSNILEVESVDALISLLSRGYGLSRREILPHIAAALKRLTGLDFGENVEKWTEWRKTIRENVEASMKETGGN